eukprot:ANDGO_02965.mRNA.1 Serine carboxypeptidase-like 25
MMDRRFFLLVGLLCSVLWFASCVGASRTELSDSGEADRITSLPGVSFDLPSRQYSGYLQVSETRRLFYWFVEAEIDPANAPLINWENGGPGCSSVSGLLTENGPFRPAASSRHASIDPLSIELEYNEDTWTRNYSVLFIESPAFVGFSTSTDPHDAVVGDARTAQDMYNALVAFVAKFPRYANRDLWISGESYGGHYVPQLTQLIAQSKAQPASQSMQLQLNLRGFLVGNPWTHPSYDARYGELGTWFSHQVIDSATYAAMVQQCDFSKGLPPGDGSACDTLYAQAMQQAGNIDLYNLYEDVCLSTSKRAGLMNFNPAAALAVSRYAPQPTPPCIDVWTEAYMSRADVQYALHVTPTLQSEGVKWVECTSALNYSMTDLLTPVVPVWTDLIANYGSLRMLVYSGDVDSVVGTAGTRAWIESALKAQVKRPWTGYLVDGQVAGYSVVYDGLTFVTVRGAGHMVPSFQAHRMLHVLHSFINNIDF